MVEDYIPDRGDVIFLDFCPQTGHEQAGVRPALVLSPRKYNQKTNLCVCCPVTKKVKKYPFEVILEGQNVQGVVLSDQVKNLDWMSRKCRFVEKIPAKTYQKVLDKLLLLINQ